MHAVLRACVCCNSSLLFVLVRLNINGQMLQVVAVQKSSQYTLLAQLRRAVCHHVRHTAAAEMCVCCVLAELHVVVVLFNVDPSWVGYCCRS
jgi:hypothetical protein